MCWEVVHNCMRTGSKHADVDQNDTQSGPARSRLLSRRLGTDCMCPALSTHGAGASSSVEAWLNGFMSHRLHRWHGSPQEGAELHQVVRESKEPPEILVVVVRQSGYTTPGLRRAPVRHPQAESVEHHVPASTTARARFGITMSDHHCEIQVNPHIRAEVQRSARISQPELGFRFLGAPVHKYRLCDRDGRGSWGPDELI